MNANTRFLGYATAVTFVVAVLAGILGNLSISPALLPLIGHRRLAEDVSGPGPVIATQILSVLWVTVFLGSVLGPVGITGYYARRSERHPLYYAVLAVVAIVGVPGLVYSIFTLLTLGVSDESLILAVIGSSILTLGMCLKVARERGPEDTKEGVPWFVFSNLALVAVIILGAILGLTVAGELASTHVEQERLSTAHFNMMVKYTAVDKDQGVLTIQHGGGDPVPASDLALKGDGFTNVSGVDQTEPGRWQGTTSPWKDGEHAVRIGDSVTVGVQADCHISLVVYYYENASKTYEEYDCAELRAESG